MSTEIIRLIRDGEKRGEGVWRWGKANIFDGVSAVFSWLHFYDSFTIWGHLFSQLTTLSCLFWTQMYTHSEMQCNTKKKKCFFCFLVENCRIGKKSLWQHSVTIRYWSVAGTGLNMLWIWRFACKKIPIWINIYKTWML